MKHMPPPHPSTPKKEKKVYERVQSKMAKLISRFTNKEECPFWPLFL